MITREILFRGKINDSVNRGRWTEGSLIKNIVGYSIRGHERLDWCDGHKVSSVDEETVGQYTGLTDKNDKKIFEGDIVRVHQFLFDGNEHEEEITVSIEYMSDCTCFGANIIDGRKIKHYMGYTGEKVVIPLCDLYGLHEESFDVIGNIHDNPELLEVQE